MTDQPTDTPKIFNPIRPAKLEMTVDPRTGQFRRRIGRRFARGRYRKNGVITGNIRYKEIAPDGSHITRPRKSTHTRRAKKRR